MRCSTATDSVSGSYGHCLELILYRHPIHNTYLPAQFRDATFLKVAGDTTGKAWDEEALVLWEKTEHGGNDGREEMRSIKRLQRRANMICSSNEGADTLEFNNIFRYTD